MRLRVGAGRIRACDYRSRALCVIMSYEQTKQSRHQWPSVRAAALFVLLHAAHLHLGAVVDRTSPVLPSARPASLSGAASTAWNGFRRQRVKTIARLALRASPVAQQGSSFCTPM